MTHVRCYLAGPMSGLPLMNYPVFNDAAARLRRLGLGVENPADNPSPPCGTWQGYMRMALRQLATVDVVVMLPGWQRSKGARLEHKIARGLGLEVWTLAQALAWKVRA